MIPWVERVSDVCVQKLASLLQESTCVLGHLCKAWIPPFPLLCAFSCFLTCYDVPKTLARCGPITPDFPASRTIKQMNFCCLYVTRVTPFCFSCRKWSKAALSKLLLRVTAKLFPLVEENVQFPNHYVSEIKQANKQKNKQEEAQGTKFTAARFPECLRFPNFLEHWTWFCIIRFIIS